MAGLMPPRVEEPGSHPQTLDSHLKPDYRAGQGVLLLTFLGANAPSVNVQSEQGAATLLPQTDLLQNRQGKIPAVILKSKETSEQGREAEARKARQQSREGQRVWPWGLQVQSGAGSAAHPVSQQAELAVNSSDAWEGLGLRGSPPSP